MDHQEKEEVTPTTYLPRNSTVIVLGLPSPSVASTVRRRRGGAASWRGERKRRSNSSKGRRSDVDGGCSKRLQTRQDPESDEHGLLSLRSQKGIYSCLQTEEPLQDEQRVNDNSQKQGWEGSRPVRWNGAHGNCSKIKSHECFDLHIEMSGKTSPPSQDEETCCTQYGNDVKEQEGTTNKKVKKARTKNMQKVVSPYFEKEASRCDKFENHNGKNKRGREKTKTKEGRKAKKKDVENAAFQSEEQRVVSPYFQAGVMNGLGNLKHKKEKVNKRRRENGKRVNEPPGDKGGVQAFANKSNKVSPFFKSDSKVGNNLEGVQKKHESVATQSGRFCNSETLVECEHQGIVLHDEIQEDCLRRRNKIEVGSQNVNSDPLVKSEGDDHVGHKAVCDGRGSPTLRFKRKRKRKSKKGIIECADSHENEVTEYGSFCNNGTSVESEHQGVVLHGEIKKNRPKGRNKMEAESQNVKPDPLVKLEDEDLDCVKAVSNGIENPAVCVKRKRRSNKEATNDTDFHENIVTESERFCSNESLAEDEHRCAVLHAETQVDCLRGRSKKENVKPDPRVELEGEDLDGDNDICSGGSPIVRVKGKRKRKSTKGTIDNAGYQGVVLQGEIQEDLLSRRKKIEVESQNAECDPFSNLEGDDLDDDKAVCDGRGSSVAHVSRQRNSNKGTTEDNHGGEACKRVSPYFQEAPFRDKVEQQTPLNLCCKRKTRVELVEFEELLSKFSYEGFEGKSDGSEAKQRKKRRDSSTVLSAAEKKAEAYLRKTPDNRWKPPCSPYNLLQEEHLHDPWRVLIICMLLNITTGPQVRKVLECFFTLCPDARTAIDTDPLRISKVIQSLGLHRKRAAMIQRFSREYLLDDWTHVTQLHGVGKYAADAYAIFCTGRWDQVKPNDHMLNHYWKFLRKRIVTFNRSYRTT